jgi:hypothetical protein
MLMRIDTVELVGVGRMIGAEPARPAQRLEVHDELVG